MNETTNGPAPVTIYDTHTDEIRVATQADINLMQRRLGELGHFWCALKALVETTKARIAS